MIALASDFDGTLFFHGENPPMRRSDAEAVRRFQQAGGLFGVCTGRSLDGISQVVGDLFSFDFYILVSGTRVLDGRGNCIRDTAVDKELAGEIVGRYRDHARTCVHGLDRMYAFSHPFPDQILISSLAEIGGENVYGLSLGAKSQEEASQICREINARYGDRLAAFQNTSDVDIVARGCSKGQGLKIVKEYFGVSCMAGIGDSYNDIPMLEKADYPFTFPYAPGAARQIAREIVGSVGEAVEKLEKMREERPAQPNRAPKSP